MQASQLCAANYHYKRYTLEAFLAAAERLGYQRTSTSRITTAPVWTRWPAASAPTA